MANDCVVCKRPISADSNCARHGDRRKGIRGSWQLVECDGCKLVAMLPLPDDEQLNRYYSAYSNDENVNLTRFPGSRYPRIRKLFHWLSGDVDPRDFVEVAVGARVLDYGCGLAGYLCDFHDRGVAISGAEIAAYVVEACKRHGFDVHQVNDLLHIPFDDAEFDVVYLMQVFEHLRDPHRFLDELDRVLKPGGYLYLAVPNSASAWRRFFGENWVSGWYAPFHLFHYNRDNLTELAHQHGFTAIDCWSSTPESWFRLNLKAVMYPSENKLDWCRSWLDSRPLRYLLMIVLRIIELPLRERDCLVLKLQKQIQ